MVSDLELYERVGQVARWLGASGQRLVSAESCTGGWIAKACTDLPGSSAWFESGFVTYANSAKVRDLGVSLRTLEAHGAVSEPTVREMAMGALRVTGADLGVAVTGIAGPDGGSPEKPVGTVWFGIGRRGGSGAIDVVAEEQRFAGSREAIRRACVDYALQLLLRVGATDAEHAAILPRA